MHKPVIRTLITSELEASCGNLREQNNSNFTIPNDIIINLKYSKFYL